MENVDKDLVSTWVKQGYSYESISQELKRNSTDVRGLSSRSVRRFCFCNGIKKMDENEVDDTIGILINEVKYS